MMHHSRNLEEEQLFLWIGFHNDEATSMKKYSVSIEDANGFRRARILNALLGHIHSLTRGVGPRQRHLAR